MDKDSFAIFIMSYNRPNIYTLKLLKKYNYIGKYYIIIDDSDPELKEYKKRYNEELIIFNKKEISYEFDIMDNLGIRNVGVYARNFINKISKEMGLKYILVLDDDYIALAYKKDDGDVLREKQAPLDINIIIEYMLDFLIETNADSVALAQAGDYIGGMNANMILKGYSRKCMNSWFMKTDNDIKFNGAMNDDVNTYTYYGSIGKIFLTYGRLFFRQIQTQSDDGGMSGIYNQTGTYLKTFYTKMLMPSCIDINPMGQNHLRIHHSIKWNNCVPKIIDGRWKK